MNQGQNTRPNSVLQKRESEEGGESHFKFFFLLLRLLEAFSGSAKGSHSSCVSRESSNEKGSMKKELGEK